LGRFCTRIFFHAVDSECKWGEDAGILTVYRLYIPTIGGVDQSLQQYLDDANWTAQNKELVEFLGLADIENESVFRFILHIEECIDRL
jgi:hypothetical protein